MRTAYFAGGCFWCITPRFESIEGVSVVVSGYSGGDEISPTYEQVKHQQTGHRETIAIVYDEKLVTYARLLEEFLDGIDPFDPDGQFIDRGFSYTTAVYYSNDAELAQAQAALAKLEAETGKKPCVSLELFKAFWRAEEYHQDYWKKNPVEFQHEMEVSGRLNPKDS